MHDLVVAARPVSADVPIDVVIVRSPSSMVPVVVGTVLIQHRPAIGLDDRVVRPADEAAGLFRRFMIGDGRVSRRR